MKLFFAALLILLPLFVRADEKPVVIKSWKTFKSDFGYGFKYPDCWEVVIDSPSGEPPLASNKDIAVNETGKCPRLRMDSNKPNGVNFRVNERSYQSEQKTKQTFENMKQSANGRAAAKPSMPTKFFKIGSYDAVAFVEDHKEFIRWEVIYDCPKNEIDLSGPSIRNPAQSYFDKFKNGDLGLPEPEKTIIESVRCSESK